jgi:hypothetical protein
MPRHARKRLPWFMRRWPLLPTYDSRPPRPCDRSTTSNRPKSHHSSGSTARLVVRFRPTTVGHAVSSRQRGYWARSASSNHSSFPFPHRGGPHHQHLCCTLCHASFRVVKLVSLTSFTYGLLSYSDVETNNETIPMRMLTMKELGANLYASRIFFFF